MSDILVYNEVKKMNDKLSINNGIGDVKSVEYNVSVTVPVTHVCTGVETMTISNKDEFIPIQVYINQGTICVDVAPRSSIALKAGISTVKITTKIGEANIVVIENMYMEGQQKANQDKISVEIANAPIYYASRNIAFANIGNGYTLAKSIDTGATWVTKLTLADTTDYFQAVYMSATGGITFTNKNKIYYSSDMGETWALSDTSAFGEISRPLWHGIDSHEGTFVFAEYDTVTPKTYRVFKSTNHGMTWKIVLSKLNPEEIRHFHSVNYIDGQWIVTSGDIDINVRWFKSLDDCETLTEITGVGSQQYRTVNVLKLQSGEVFWASDGSMGLREICKADMSNIVSTTTPIYNLSGSCFGIFTNGSNILAITSVEDADLIESRPALYVSRDCGKTWNCEFQTNLSVGLTSGGFRAISGMNDKGEVIIYYRNTLINISGGIPFIKVKF